MATYRAEARKVIFKLAMDFLKDLIKGLTSRPKYLYSKYFYDYNGDRIFQEIMKMPEYYLTDSEYEIFSTRAGDILKALSTDHRKFELVEFGAGDGFKTKMLIQRLLEEGTPFRYVPIDISDNVLNLLKEDINAEFPDLEVLPIHSDYFKAIKTMNQSSDNPKLVLFIGSSIGNFRPGQTENFLKSLRDSLRGGDQVLIGFDLRKNPKIILEAYNDPAGITKSFNLNILQRANRELDANFRLESFDHYALYDPDDGTARSYLVSLLPQTVHIGAGNVDIQFGRGETIHTEVSRKFLIPEIEKLAVDAGFVVVEHFFDCRHYYVNTLIKKPN